MATAQELAWLRERNEPPPRSMVWLGCWDCEREIPVNYQPSDAPLPTADATKLAGHPATFTLGYVAFQVFSVDFVAAEVHGAEVWNTRPSEQLREALMRIWPQQLAPQDVEWPGAAFRGEDWPRLVRWDGRLGGLSPR